MNKQILVDFSRNIKITFITNDNKKFKCPSKIYLNSNTLLNFFEEHTYQDVFDIDINFSSSQLNKFMNYVLLYNLEHKFTREEIVDIAYICDYLEYIPDLDLGIKDMIKKVGDESLDQLKEVQNNPLSKQIFSNIYNHMFEFYKNNWKRKIGMLKGDEETLNLYKKFIEDYVKECLERIESPLNSNVAIGYNTLSNKDRVKKLFSNLSS